MHDNICKLLLYGQKQYHKTNHVDKSCITRSCGVYVITYLKCWSLWVLYRKLNHNIYYILKHTHSLVGQSSEGLFVCGLWVYFVGNKNDKII